MPPHGWATSKATSKVQALGSGVWALWSGFIGLGVQGLEFRVWSLGVKKVHLISEGLGAIGGDPQDLGFRV